jgi:hypothetical protein
MDATYISIIAILFCVGSVKSYISNYDRRYIYDKKIFLLTYCWCIVVNDIYWR